jgi:hypothetical protein
LPRDFAVELKPAGAKSRIRIASPNWRRGQQERKGSDKKYNSGQRFHKRVGFPYWYSLKMFVQFNSGEMQNEMLLLKSGERFLCQRKP